MEILNLMFPTRGAGLFHKHSEQVAGTQMCCRQCDAWLAASASSAELHGSICHHLSLVAWWKIKSVELSFETATETVSDLEKVGRQRSAGLSRHFSRSCWQANQVNKSEETRKVEYAYHFWKCTDSVHPKLIHACRNYSMPKWAYFAETQCRLTCNIEQHTGCADGEHELQWVKEEKHDQQR